MNAYLLWVVMALAATPPQPQTPEFSMSIFHRRNAQTHTEWESLSPGDTVHYLEHGPIPYFRMYSVEPLPPVDSTQSFAITAITLYSYAADSLVQEVHWGDGKRPFAHSRQIPNMNRYDTGLPERVDYEVLEISCLAKDSDGVWQEYAEGPIRIIVMLDESLYIDEEE